MGTIFNYFILELNILELNLKLSWGHWYFLSHLHQIPLITYITIGILGLTS